MVADMSVGVAGLHDVFNELEENNKNSKIRNKYLAELIKLKKIEITEKKPEVMFLFELLDFLKSIPLWNPDDIPSALSDSNDDYSRQKACFVGEKWNGRIEMYRDYENLTDIKAIEGEVIPFDVLYYINKLEDALSVLYDE